MNQIRFLQLRVFLISNPLLQIKVLPINHLLLPLNVLLINHLVLLLLGVPPICHLNLLLLLQLLYPKTPTNRRKARWSTTKQKRNRSMLHPTRTIQTRKRAVSCKTKTKQKRKKQYDRGMEMGG